MAAVLKEQAQPVVATDPVVIIGSGPVGMAMISVAVAGLTRLETIVPAVQDLGRRHVKYGVKDKHYDTVASALVWTLGQGLGESFTPEVKEAWVSTYGVLAKTMKDAAATVAA